MQHVANLTDIRQQAEGAAIQVDGVSHVYEGPNGAVPALVDISLSVATGRFDAGLIIHEGQLTFQNQGLHLIVDLGAWWYERTGLPLPLGGNVVRRDLGPETMKRISRLLKESICYALDHRQDALDYALQYARDMDAKLADKFVGMYVNHWTLDYGDHGRAAVRRLLEEGHKAGIIAGETAVEFVE